MIDRGAKHRAKPLQRARLPLGAGGVHVHMTINRERADVIPWRLTSTSAATAATTAAASPTRAADWNVTDHAIRIEGLATLIDDQAQRAISLQVGPSQRAATGHRRSLVRLKGALDERIVHRRIGCIVVAVALFALLIPIYPGAQTETLPWRRHQRHLARRRAVVL